MRTRPFSLIIVAAVAMLFLAACGGEAPATPSVVSVEIDGGPVSLVVGAQVQLTATVTTLGGASAAVLWTSDEGAIAGVDASGLVVAAAAGATTIRATSAVDASKGDAVSVTVESASSAGTRYVTMSASGEHTLAIDEHGSAWAWGRGWNGQLGTGELAPQLGDVNRPVKVVQPVEVDRFVAVAAGGYHSLALDDTGRIWSWGNNAIGQLGIGVMTPSEPRPLPSMVAMPEGVTSFIAIAAGINHSAALDQAGRAWAWGDGETVGQGSYLGDQPAPVLVATPVGEPTFNAITARGGNTFALDQNGRAWGWGRNSSDVLGIHPGSTAYTPVPILMPVDDDGAVIPYAAITGGGGLVLALDGGGKAWAWGSNLNGELGNGAMATQSTVPVEVAKDPSVSFVAVAAGQHHALALDAEGRAWAWGLATHGELGNGDVDTNRLTPVLVTLPLGVPSFSGIAAGYHHSLALDGDSAMWAWGRGEQGMRGDGTFEYTQALPVPVVAP